MLTVTIIVIHFLLPVWKTWIIFFWPQTYPSAHFHILEFPLSSLDSPPFRGANIGPCMGITFPLYPITPASHDSLFPSCVWMLGLRGWCFYSNMNIPPGPPRSDPNLMNILLTWRGRSFWCQSFEWVWEYERKLEIWSESKEGDPARLSQFRFLGL